MAVQLTGHSINSKYNIDYIEQNIVQNHTTKAKHKLAIDNITGIHYSAQKTMGHYRQPV